MHGSNKVATLIVVCHLLTMCNTLGRLPTLLKEDCVTNRIGLAFRFTVMLNDEDLSGDVANLP